MTPAPYSVPKGFESYPYAPRSTDDTLRSSAFIRLRIPPDTEPRVCRFCGGRVWWTDMEPEHVDSEGRTIGASHLVVDAEPDVAGVAPVAPDTWGSGISHTLLCEIPRPLPPHSPDHLATSTKNSNVPSGQPVRVPIPPRP